MRWTWLLSIAFLGAIFGTARAEPYRPAIVPPCVVRPVTGGGETCGYDLDGVRAVYAADAELVKNRRLLSIERDRSAALAAETASLRSSLAAERRAVEIRRGHEAALTRQLLACDERFQRERVKPRWGTAASWGTAAILGVVLTGLVVRELLDDP